jgi:hypothetical protein
MNSNLWEDIFENSKKCKLVNFMEHSASSEGNTCWAGQ